MYLFSNGAFYSYDLFELYGDNWPLSGVDVSEEDHAIFMGPPPTGKKLGTNKEGMPCWVDMEIVKPTFPQALAASNSHYVKDRDELCAAWLRAAVADGVEESSRKEDVEMELAELDAKHSADVAALKSEYGVDQ